jgi:2-amino-4-hydroxy-6-hydroxymethyldihydropteridine diphosphokinase
MAKSNIAIIGIGSNIGAEDNITAMLKILGDAVKLLDVSSFVKTKPLGNIRQPDFTNGAVKVETSMGQSKLRKFLKEIEDDLGRDRSVPKYGPRTIDLDLIVWNGEIIDNDYYKRDFLRKSIQEIS